MTLARSRRQPPFPILSIQSDDWLIRHVSQLSGPWLTTPDVKFLDLTRPPTSITHPTPSSASLTACRNTAQASYSSIARCPYSSRNRLRLCVPSRHLLKRASHSTFHKMTDSKIQEGDKVSWSWGSGQPGGKVAEVKEQGEIAIESNRGNTIKKNADPENPAVHIERSGNDVVKRASELQIDKKTEGGSNGDSKDDKNESESDKKEEKKDDDKPTEPDKKDEEMNDAPASEKNGDPKDEQDTSESKEDSKEESKADTENTGDDLDEAQAGDKRKVDETNGVEAEKKAPASKKTKTDGAEDKGEDEDDAENEEKAEEKPKGKAGRPRAGEKKEKKEPAKKKQSKPAATEDGQPRRSARNK
ncbi:uncharacterized protein EKO05_0005038 [Ascochyta rabiei]|uniref:uncharacterized protein n=1 Tax=Didymella rabiei TaxID=5454 RepID=UPI00220594D0|nr:uncharacterized protein EKO05_0005038 [Ascochyta rabiei]UPX14560.1 hypothetical protein EKO05_0005038 [Ascochyta rabiei]